MATATTRNATRSTAPARSRTPKARPADVCRLSVTIRATVYSLRPLPSEDGRAWRLRKADGTTYDVAETPHGPTCDCGDQTFRHEGIDSTGCKHVRSLRALGLIADATSDPEAGDPSTWPAWTDAHTYRPAR